MLPFGVDPTWYELHWLTPKPQLAGNRFSAAKALAVQCAIVAVIIAAVSHL